MTARHSKHSQIMCFCLVTKNKAWGLSSDLKIIHLMGEQFPFLFTWSLRAASLSHTWPIYDCFYFIFVISSSTVISICLPFMILKAITKYFQCFYSHFECTIIWIYLFMILLIFFHKKSVTYYYPYIILLILMKKKTFL